MRLRGVRTTAMMPTEKVFGFLKSACLDRIDELQAIGSHNRIDAAARELTDSERDELADLQYVVRMIEAGKVTL